MSPHAFWDYKSLLFETKGFWSRRGVIDLSTLDGALCAGDAGWELVAVVPVSDGNVGTARLLCTFKRPRPATDT